MKLTYYGHSCFSVRLGGKTLLFDPFIRPNELAAKVDVDAIHPDIILISHGHFDHIADAVELARSSNALVIANYEIAGWLNGQEVQNTHAMNIGGTYAADWGKVKMVNAIHSSGLPDGTFGGMAGGYVVESAEGNFYFAGDSALTMDMQLIGRMHKLDFAVLPIGDTFTMSAEDAAICAEFVNVNKVVGIHYDTFPPIRIDKDKAKGTFRDSGRELILVPIGEEMDI